MLERNLYNYGYNYRNYRYNYGPTFYPVYSNPTYVPYTNYAQVPKDTINEEKVIDNENVKTEDFSSDNVKDETVKEGNSFRFGPLTVSNNRISLFGFSVALDDLIILAIVLFLIMENSCDYALLIVLGLLLLDSTLGSIGELGFLKNLNLFG